MSACKHEQFMADVAVNRFEDTGGFMAEVRIKCSQCELPFEFLGLEPGYDNQGARVSLDGQEALLAIVPKGARPNPLQRLSYGIKRFDS